MLAYLGAFCARFGGLYERKFVVGQRCQEKRSQSDVVDALFFPLRDARQEVIRCQVFVQHRVIQEQQFGCAEPDEAKIKSWWANLRLRFERRGITKHQCVFSRLHQVLNNPIDADSAVARGGMRRVVLLWIAFVIWRDIGVDRLLLLLLRCTAFGLCCDSLLATTLLLHGCLGGFWFEFFICLSVRSLVGRASIEAAIEASHVDGAQGAMVLLSLLSLRRCLSTMATGELVVAVVW